MDTTSYVSVTFKKGLLIEGGLHPQCSQGEVLSQDEYVKYSDVEKAVKLWESVAKPSCHQSWCGFDCVHMLPNKYSNSKDDCRLFGYLLDYDTNCMNKRCQQCVAIFGGE
jgi:hypothetical protein